MVFSHEVLLETLIGEEVAAFSDKEIQLNIHYAVISDFILCVEKHTCKIKIKIML